MKRIVIVIFFLGIVVGFAIHDHLTRPAAAKIVTIKSRNLEYQVATTAETVEELLKEQGIMTEELMNERTNEQSIGSSVHRSLRLVNGSTISINKQINVVINDGVSVLKATTTAETVGDLLNEQEIGLAATDRVTPRLNSYLASGMQVEIDRIVVLEVKEVSEIPYQVTVQNDPNELYGRGVVAQDGIIGRKEQLFLITYENGREIARRLLSEKVVREPISEIKTFGTRIEAEEIREGGASWYAYRGCMCAAYPKIAHGRFVRVTSLASGKSAIVRINDFGPDQSIHPDRVIDLDAVAFEYFAPLGAGLINVKVELIK